MNQAINAYYSITASPEFRELERMREKARHDEAQALHHAEQRGLEKGLEKGRAEGLEKGRAEGLEKGRAEGLEKGRAEGMFEIARTMFADGEPFSKILRYTGLTSEELKAISQ